MATCKYNVRFSEMQTSKYFVAEEKAISVRCHLWLPSLKKNDEY